MDIAWVNVAGVLLVVLEAATNTTNSKENRLRVRAIVINMVDVHLNEVNNTVLLDEGCGLHAASTAVTNEDSNELHLHCEVRAG